MSRSLDLEKLLGYQSSAIRRALPLRDAGIAGIPRKRLSQFSYTTHPTHMASGGHCRFYEPCL